MLLIQKIDNFTQKKIDKIKKYINQINTVQLIREQLGGVAEQQLRDTNTMIARIFDNADNDYSKITEIIDKYLKNLEVLKKLNKENEEIKRTIVQAHKRFIELRRKQEILAIVIKNEPNKPGLTEYYKRNIEPLFDNQENDMFKENLFSLKEEEQLNIFFQKLEMTTPVSPQELTKIIKRIILDTTIESIPNRSLKDEFKSLDENTKNIMSLLPNERIDAILSTTNNPFLNRTTGRINVEELKKFITRE